MAGFIARLENFRYAIEVEKVAMQPVKESQVYGTKEGETKYVPQAGDIAASVLIRVYAKSKS